MRGYEEIFLTAFVGNFKPYSTVPISRRCNEYPEWSSDLEKIVSLKTMEKEIQYLRVAIVTVIHKAMKFGT